MNQIISFILAHDYSFSIINPEKSKGFIYSKKARTGNNRNISNRKNSGTENAEISPVEIKNIITTRPGMIFVNSLILSAVFFALLTAAGLILKFSWPVFAVYSIIYPASLIIIYKILDKSFYKLYLYYKIEGGKKTFFDRLNDNLYELSGVSSILHIDKIALNKKRNSHGGAGEIYDRHAVRTIKASPGYIKTNVNIWSFELRNSRIFFFPDYIILEKQKRNYILEYESLDIEYIEKPYCETDKNPDDAEIIGTTWLHPKKNGEPDRRFRNNSKISIVLYAELKISSAGNLFHFQISNLKIVHMFYKFISENSMKYSEHRYNKSEKAKSKKKKTNNEERSRSDVKLTLDEEIEKSYNVLGLTNGAAVSEIKTAYYLMAKKYHPDLVSNKKIKMEYNEKMKEINKAYDRLKGIVEM